MIELLVLLTVVVPTAGRRSAAWFADGTPGASASARPGSGRCSPAGLALAVARVRGRAGAGIRRPGRRRRARARTSWSSSLVVAGDRRRRVARPPRARGWQPGRSGRTTRAATTRCCCGSRPGSPPSRCSTTWGSSGSAIEATTIVSALLVGFTRTPAGDRGGLEVPDPGLGRDRLRAARHAPRCTPRRSASWARRATRSPGPASIAIAPHLDPASRPPRLHLRPRRLRHEGRPGARSTPGCPTPTARRRARSRPCCPAPRWPSRSTRWRGSTSSRSGRWGRPSRRPCWSSSACSAWPSRCRSSSPRATSSGCSPTRRSSTSGSPRWPSASAATSRCWASRLHLVEPRAHQVDGLPGRGTARQRSAAAAGSAAWRAASHAHRSTGGALVVAALVLAGLPPSGIFVAELAILFGGVAAGWGLAAAVAALLLALAVAGLLFHVVRVASGRRRPRRDRPGAEPPLARSLLRGRPAGRRSWSPGCGRRRRWPRRSTRWSQVLGWRSWLSRPPAARSTAWRARGAGRGGVLGPRVAELVAAGGTVRHARRARRTLGRR